MTRPLAAPPAATRAATARAPSGLLCELLAMPALTTIENPRPAFDWIVNDAAPEATQQAYQLRVATSAAGLCDGLTDMWDSGRLLSSKSGGVRYGGKPLAAFTRYWWTVRTWNAQGDPSPWATPQEFRTGAVSALPAFTRYPIQQSAVAPLAVVRKGEGHWFMDFGRAAFATLRLTLSSDVDGHVVRVHLGEKLAAPASLDRAPPGTVRYREATLTLRRGRHTYTVAIPPDARNTGPMAIPMPPTVGDVLPFRYAELESLPGTLTATDVRQLAAHYPFDDAAAQFACDDPVLTAVWDLCKHTMRATSFCGLYVDGDRERIPYTADAYINQLSHYAVDREFTLARVSTEYCLRKPTWPTEWILHGPLMAWADYLHTGNPDLIQRCFADLDAATLTALARADGLISTRTGLVTADLLRSLHMENPMRPLEDIVDWPPAEFTDGGRGERDDYDMAPVNTVVNAFHHQALTVMARMADAVGRGADAARYRERAACVAESFQRVFFDSSRGIYVDGEGSRHAALHANMLPLAFGLVPPAQRATVTAFVKSRGMACSVYGAQYLLEALYAADADDHALDLMTARHDRSWWNMLAAGSTMTLEAWDLKYKRNLDWNHAWGAAPGNIIPRFLMGVRPLTPGFQMMLIQPRPGRLRRAELTLPTIRGPVRAAFTRERTAFTLEIDIPANTSARVALPTFGSASPLLTVDGQPHRGNVSDRHVFIDGIGSGRHTLRRMW